MSPRGRLAARALPLLTLALALAACSEEPLNVVLVSIDTLRADHLGCYGYSRDTSPRIDELAEHSLRCENAIAPAPWTLPSHAGMLTGRHPFEIGVTEQKSRLPDEVQTLAERLSDAGYETVAWVDSQPGGFVGAQRGFERGFDEYHHAPLVKGALYRYDMAASVDAVLEWLEEERDDDDPFFVFLHTKSVHTAPADKHLLAESDVPYHKPPDVRRRFLPEGKEHFRWSDSSGNAGVAWLKEANRRIESGELDYKKFPPERVSELVALYDAGIWYTDEHLGRLLDGLERLGLAENTLVIVTADHGEAFLDNRRFLHTEVYGSVLRVPLVIHDPRKKDGTVLDAPVSLLDVTPTILDRVGLTCDGLDGRPLPPSEAQPPPRTLFSSMGGNRSEAAAFQEGSWKVVLLKERGASATELYNVEEDPLDQYPREDPEREERMRARLLGWLDQTRAPAPEIELDRETVEELEKLGYGGE